ncbi:MAG: hypothetical protein GY714_14845 [Desulfobacterales bacterium]|nr:hypothetical protein [Desulfobacterales bacterium]
MIYDQKIVTDLIEEIRINSLCALTKCSKLKELYQKLKIIFNRINDQLFWITPFEVVISPTKDIIEPWYYDPKSQSKYSVLIERNGECCYIFRELDWSLDDEISVNKQIADRLGDWEIFHAPTNVRDIEALLKKNCWKFDKDKIPKIGDYPPEDTREILSWDKKYVLTGTTIDNMCRVTRDKWSEICRREYWFKNSD